MRTITYVILAIAAVIIVPTIAFLTYLSVADLTVHKAYFEDEISEALGHHVSINGPFDLQFGGQIVFTAEDVSASNPDWSMIGDSMEIDALEFTGIQFDLHENRDGRVNWEPNLTEMQAVAVQYDNSNELPVVLHRMALENIGISYEKEGDSAQALGIDAFQLDREAGGAMAVEATGSYTVDAATIPFRNKYA
jgi:uncharacterized protein involved in outer membrane biogenesis